MAFGMARAATFLQSTAVWQLKCNLLNDSGSPLQPQWFSKTETLKSTLLFLVVLKTNYFCLASKLIHHSCDSEGTEKTA